MQFFSWNTLYIRPTLGNSRGRTSQPARSAAATKLRSDWLAYRRASQPAGRHLGAAGGKNGASGRKSRRISL